MKKRRLHPALRESRGPFSDSSHDKYREGSIQLCGIDIDIQWDKIHNCWSLSSPNLISDIEVQRFLNDLFVLAPNSFSDEWEFVLSEISDVGSMFYLNDGTKWMMTEQTIENDDILCIQINTKTNFPNGKIRFFKSDTLIYMYDK